MYKLYHNNKVIHMNATYNECLIKLQQIAPYSWHHAFKYEGWKIIKTSPSDLIRSIKDLKGKYKDSLSSSNTFSKNKK
ncbi:hypothetical protein LCGC14_2431820 [marine sediment metagenome]|uniref:Uncharacterized protein n=1 Tax=marine sediment metagenome TaxID=412755 RepID=A0A0F9C941_9ZZZZ